MTKPFNTDPLRAWGVYSFGQRRPRLGCPRRGLRVSRLRPGPLSSRRLHRLVSSDRCAAVELVVAALRFVDDPDFRIVLPLSVVSVLEDALWLRAVDQESL
jgi:hypothetical protein